MRTIWSNFDLGIPRHVNRVVLLERKSLAVGFYGCFALQTDQSDFVIVAVESDRRITGGERDAAVVQITGGCRARSDSRAAPFAFVRLGHETGFRRDCVLSYSL